MCVFFSLKDLPSFCLEKKRQTSICNLQFFVLLRSELAASCRDEAFPHLAAAAILSCPPRRVLELASMAGWPGCLATSPEDGVSECNHLQLDGKQEVQCGEASCVMPCTTQHTSCDVLLPDNGNLLDYIEGGEWCERHRAWEGKEPSTSWLAD